MRRPALALIVCDVSGHSSVIKCWMTAERLSRVAAHTARHTVEEASSSAAQDNRRRGNSVRVHMQALLYAALPSSSITDLWFCCSTCTVSECFGCLYLLHTCCQLVEDVFYISLRFFWFYDGFGAVPDSRDSRTPILCICLLFFFCVFMFIKLSHNWIGIFYSLPHFAPHGVHLHLFE